MPLAPGSVCACWRCQACLSVALHFSVSAVNLIRMLHVQAGDDISSLLTAFGSWQPSLASHRGPSVLDAMLGGLGGQGPDRVRLAQSRCLDHQCSLNSYILLLAVQHSLHCLLG